MVKAVVGEETRLKLAEDRLSQSTVPAEVRFFFFLFSFFSKFGNWQVGLVIGKLSTTLDQGFVFDLIPTPQNDAGEPACSIAEITSKDVKKKPSKSKSQRSDSISLVIDKDWVAEHARQVSRMLLGGMKVVGIYVWASDSTFKNSTIALCQTVNGVARAVPFPEADSDERLLIHVCYSPRRWTCRNCTLTSNITSSSLRPCDFKMGRVLNSLQTFKCMYNFCLRLPICLGGATNTQTLNDILRQTIVVHANKLRGAKAMVDGNFVVIDDPCSSDGLHEVELLLPFFNDTSAVVLAIVNHGDIIRSLLSRLDIIWDEADEDLASNDNIGYKASNEKPVSKLVLRSLRKTCSLSFPRRVFVPWLVDTYICDYLQQSETLENIVKS